MVLSVVLAIAGVGGVTLVVFQGRSGAETPAAQTPRPVQIAKVTHDDGVREFRASGITRAINRAELSFTLGGRLMARPVDIGDEVHAGDVLAQIDQAPLKTAVQAAAAQAREATAHLSEAYRARHRSRVLARDDAVSQAQVDQVTAQLRALRAGGAAARSQREEAVRMLDEATLRAPFDGIVSQVLLEPGEFAVPGRPVVVLSGVAGDEVEVEVPESQIARINAGSAVEVNMPLAGLKNIHGTVRLVGHSAGQVGRQFPVVVRIDPTAPVVPGMAAEVVFHTHVAPGMSLPAIAILNPNGDSPSVFVVKAGRAKRVPVHVRELVDNRAIVTAGVQEGEPVVVGGQAALVDGEAVSIVHGESPSDTSSPPDPTNGSSAGVSMSSGVGKHPHSRIVLVIVPIFALMGVAAWLFMPRQEDPTFPSRYGDVTVLFPGAEAETIERLVVKPMEEQLEQVDALRYVDATSRQGVALFTLELRPDIYDTHSAWDDVRNAIARARRKLPKDAGAPLLNDSFVDQESMVYAVTGSTDPLVLRSAARKLRRALLHIDGVSRVTMIADPGEQVTIEYDQVAAQRLGINQRVLAAELQGRNSAIPGGSVLVGQMRADLSPETDFGSIADIEHTPIMLPSGGSVELREVAHVRHGPADPIEARMRQNGEPAVAIGVVAQNGINLIRLGERVRKTVERMQNELQPLQIQEVSFQPHYVAQRLSGLGRSLLASIAIVAVMLLLTMGLRSSLIVSAMVPIVALGTLAIYWMGGGVLHQLSIAAFVIALGMLVDNAIVVVEDIQAKLDEGMLALDAARASVRELGIPLAGATATTVAAYLPMLLAKGTTADFIRALPVVIIIALTLSLLGALFVTPLMSAWLLERRAIREGWIERVASRIGGVGVRRHRLVLLVAGSLMICSLLGIGLIGQRFFPSADRNQVVVELHLREGTHIENTDAAAHVIERALARRHDVVNVTTFVGRGPPRFYYNVSSPTHVPNLAAILLTTRSASDVAAVAAAARHIVATKLPEAEATVQSMEQGPYVRAPIVVRVYDNERKKLAAASETVLRELERIKGTTDVRSDLDLGAPTLRVHVVDAAAARQGVTRSDVALAMLTQSRGLTVGEYRGGNQAVPIVLRSSQGERTRVEDLPGMGVSTRKGGLVPLGQVATAHVEWRPAHIERRNGHRLANVMSGLLPGHSYGPVLEALEARLAHDHLPKGVRLEYAGAVQGAGEANASLLKVFPIGLALIVLCLVFEFRSFRRTAIVMATVPLCMVGIIPGLIISRQPFGFMSLLGALSLAGIVVNNAIVLLDFVERDRASGMRTEQALIAAVRTRTRPIVLTTGTTVAGLLPLAFSSSTLWPPLAWAMISGLLASTFLTLFVVPALYKVMIREDVQLASPLPEQVDDELDDGPTLVGSPIQVSGGALPLTAPTSGGSE